MRLFILLPVLLVGCIPFDNSTKDAEHRERRIDAEIEQLRAINHEMVKAFDLQFKAYEQVLVRLKSLENPEVRPIPRLKKNPEV